MPTPNPTPFEKTVEQMTRGIEDWGYCKGASISFNDDDFEGIEPALARKVLVKAAHHHALEMVKAELESLLMLEVLSTGEARFRSEFKRRITAINKQLAGDSDAAQRN